MTTPLPDHPRPLGRTGITVTALTIGTSALGNPERVSEDEAQTTLAFALAGPWTIDTSNGYDDSEARIGRALTTLATAGGPTSGGRTGRLLATKVDPLKGDPDFSGARVRQSVRESMDRLGVDHLDLVSLHDPERIPFEDAMAPGGPVRALLELRDSGSIGHLGVAGGPIGLLQQFVRTGHFEAVVTHNRYTLVDRSAGPLLDQCAEQGIAVFNAAPFGGGFLTAGPDGPQNYCYRPATPARLAARRTMAERCAAFGVDLATAALQFSLRDPRVTSTIVGMSRRRQLEQTLQRAVQPVPDELWQQLEQAAPAPEQWLGPDA